MNFYESYHAKEIKSEMNDFFFAKDHLDFYHEYVNVEQKYLAGIKEVRTKLEILDDEFHHRFDHNPIHHMEWRLKSPHSVVEKMKRRNLPVEVSSIKGNIEDIAGIRVICHYIKDIYRMSDLLLRQDDIHLLKIKVILKNPKENGYRSLHLVVEVPVYLADEKVMVPVEIQIRTIADGFLGNIMNIIYVIKMIKKFLMIFVIVYQIVLKALQILIMKWKIYIMKSLVITKILKANAKPLAFII